MSSANVLINSSLYENWLNLSFLKSSNYVKHFLIYENSYENLVLHFLSKKKIYKKIHISWCNTKIKASKESKKKKISLKCLHSIRASKFQLNNNGKTKKKINKKSSFKVKTEREEEIKVTKKNKKKTRWMLETKSAIFHRGIVC